MKHCLESKRFKKFLFGAGISIENESAHNVLTLKNSVTGEKIELEAISDDGIAAGIPGIYVQKKVK